MLIVFEALVSHIHAIRVHFQNRRTPVHEPHLTYIYAYEGKYLEMMGRSEEAKTVFQNLLDALHHIHGLNAENASIADTYGRLGKLHLRNGRSLDVLDRAHDEFEFAESMCQKELQMRHSIHGSNTTHDSIPATLANLAEVYRSLGKFERAETMLRKEIVMRYDMNGSNAIEKRIADAFGVLATVYRQQGKPIEADYMKEKEQQILWCLKEANDTNDTDQTRTTRDGGYWRMKMTIAPAEGDSSIPESVLAMLMSASSNRRI